MSYGSPDASFTPAPAISLPAPRTSRLRRSSPDFGSVVGGILDVGRLGLDFFAESNRNDAVRQRIRADETIALARSGFSTGRADIAPGLVGSNPSAGIAFPSGGSSFDLSSAIPLGIAAVAVLAVLK